MTAGRSLPAARVPAAPGLGYRTGLAECSAPR